jgi:hypothetical protein
VKGVVFGLFEQAYVREHGDDAWDDLLDAAGLAGAYTSLGSYPDDDLGRLVEQAAVTLGQPPQDVIRWLGLRSLPALAASFPSLFEAHSNTRSFLGTVNEIIHPEVRKLYPGADVPWFGFSTTPDGDLVMVYQSQRRLCAFAEGLILGAAAHYGEPVSVVQPRCMLHGDPTCELVVHLGPA